MDKLLSLLQFSDGLFPSGGYAHSFGLETLAQNGSVKNAEHAHAFLRSYIIGMAGPCDAAAVRLSLRHAKNNGFSALIDLDAFLHALKPVKEFREASLQMGRQTLKTMLALTDNKMVHNFYEKTQLKEARGHHAVIYGIAGSAFSWDEKAAVLSYLYSSVSQLLGACMRLLPIGQTQGQTLLRSMMPLIAQLAEESEAKTTKDMHSFAPALEISGMRHAALSARLFKS